MFKIKLLILLFLSFYISACSSQNTYDKSNRFSVDYIEGGIDGRNLSNLLISYLKTYGLYSSNSPFLIKSKIAHKQNLYIPRIDNTSDRELIRSTMLIDLINNQKNCLIANFELENEQFYVIASSKNNISNNKAIEEIKFNNTEALVHDLISLIEDIQLECSND